MGLIALIVCMILNIFIGSEQFNFVLTIISLIIFIGFTAYDIQKIKRLSESSNLPEDNLAIYGALELYLDYINIFLDILKLVGESKD